MEAKLSKSRVLFWLTFFEIFPFFLATILIGYFLTFHSMPADGSIAENIAEIFFGVCVAIAIVFWGIIGIKRYLDSYKKLETGVPKKDQPLPNQ